MTLLDLSRLTELVEGTDHDAFRIETLPAYATPITSAEYRRWLDGEVEPNWEARKPWLDTLTRWVREGRQRRRVRVIHDPISTYERYACDWSYPSSVEAGELVRVLDLAEQEPPEKLLSAPEDWSLLDDRKVVKMHYGSDSQFQGAQVVGADRLELYRSAAAAVWEAAVPFGQWWASHPQHHRRAGHPAR